MKKILPFLFSLYCCALSAQTNSFSSNSLQVSPDTAVSLYYKFTDQRSRLYNGKEFIQYDPRIEGHAFFSDRELMRGSVVYDGLVFENVNMQYDLVKDELVIQHFDVFFKLVLLSDKVKEFKVADHLFKRLVKDSINNLPVATGFYDFLHEGNITLLAKRIKRIDETVTDKVNKKVVERNFYYIIKDGTYYQVRNLKSLLSVFKDRSREVKQDLRKNRLKFRKNREASIIRAVSFYDSSNK